MVSRRWHHKEGWCSGGDKFDEKVKKAWSKPRKRITATDVLVRGKIQLIEEGTNFVVSHIKLE